jgi:hypothetical protein
MLFTGSFLHTCSLTLWGTAVVNLGGVDLQWYMVSFQKLEYTNIKVLVWWLIAIRVTIAWQMYAQCRYVLVLVHGGSVSYLWLPYWLQGTISRVVRPHPHTDCSNWMDETCVLCPHKCWCASPYQGWNEGMLGHLSAAHQPVTRLDAQQRVQVEGTLHESSSLHFQKEKAWLSLSVR